MRTLIFKIFNPIAQHSPIDPLSLQKKIDLSLSHLVARGSEYRTVARGSEYRTVARGSEYRTWARGSEYRTGARGSEYRSGARGSVSTTSVK